MGSCFSKRKYKEPSIDRHTPLELMLFPPHVLQHIKENINKSNQSLSDSFDYEKTVDRHQNVTIMFIDIVNFTPLITNKDPLVITRFLHCLFRHIEDIKSNYPTITKVETIGDCIVFAEGIFSKEHNPLVMVEFAEAILDKLSKLTYNSKKIDVRIGIDIGEIGTCVIGSYAPRLCIFGDTVVYASRLQSAGQPNEITCSERFQNYITDKLIIKRLSEVSDKLNGSQFSEDNLIRSRFSEKHENTEMKGLPPSTTYSYHHIENNDGRISFESFSKILEKH